jgi:hypothetical protein
VVWREESHHHEVSALHFFGAEQRSFSGAISHGGFRRLQTGNTCMGLSQNYGSIVDSGAVVYGQLYKEMCAYSLNVWVNG